MQTRNVCNICIIDVSRHQGSIDWLAVASSGVQGAFVKASEGIGYIDPLFRRNAVGAPAAGLKAGFYHYARPETGNTAKQEAEAFAEAVGGLPSELPHVLDVEGEAADLGPEALTAWVHEWLTEVERLTGHRTMIYTGASFARSYLGPTLAAWPLWVAHYGVDTPMGNSTWDKWAAFQFTSSGQIVGIDGNVDVNEMALDYWQELFPLAVPIEIPADAMKLEQWQWMMLYDVMGAAYNAEQLEWSWMQKIVDRTMTVTELAFLNTVLDGRVDRDIQV